MSGAPTSGGPSDQPSFAEPAKVRRLAAIAGGGEDTYKVTLTDTKPPRLVLPKVPAVGDTARLCAWLTAVFNLHAASPIVAGHQQGLRGANGHVVLERRNAAPLRFEPVSRINNPARLIEDLSWQVGPHDGAAHALKAADCRQVAHVVRMLCGSTKAISDEEETVSLLLTFLNESELVEGCSCYGPAAERYEAAQALQRTCDEHTGRPRGVVKHLTDRNTGEVVARVSDIADSFRRQLGSSVGRGFVEGRMAGLGFVKATLDGHRFPGRAGRNGPHARCQVFRGHLPGLDDEDAVVTDENTVTAIAVAQGLPVVTGAEK